MNAFQFLGRVLSHEVLAMLCTYVRRLQIKKPKNRTAEQLYLHFPEIIFHALQRTSSLMEVGVPNLK